MKAYFKSLLERGVERGPNRAFTVIVSGLYSLPFCIVPFVFQNFLFDILSHHSSNLHFSIRDNLMCA